MKRFAIMAIGVLGPAGSYAHHSTAPIYDQEQSTTIEGTVTEFRFRNPHARIYLDVVDDEGNRQRWMAEGSAPGRLLRWNWTSDEVQPGDRVRITGAPSRDGSYKILWDTISLPDGRELEGGNGGQSSRRERGALLERLERQRLEARQAQGEGSAPSVEWLN
jgi:hypothetical protein